MSRLQGIETIRELLTGAAITLILDLPFLILFIAVMFFYSWELALIALGVLTLLTCNCIDHAVVSAPIKRAIRGGRA